MAQSSSNGDGSGLSLRLKFRSDSMEGFVERYGGDVTSGGIFVRAKKPLPVGTPIKFSMALMNGLPVLVGKGTVVWVREGDPNRPESPPGMGIRFDELTDESRIKLGRILEVKAAREKMGRGPVPGRGPTPVPDAPFEALPGATEKTMKVRMTDAGEMVRDMPAEPKPAAMGGTTGRERLRTPTQTFGAEPTKLAAPGTNLLNSLQNRRGPIIEKNRPETERNFAAEAAKRTGQAPGPVAAAKAAAAKAFSEAPTKGAPGAKSPAGAPPQVGVPSMTGERTRSTTPAPDLLRRATPPPAVAPSIFSRPAPAQGGAVPSRPLAKTPHVPSPAAEKPAPAARPAAGGPSKPSDWSSSEKTEIVENIPMFDELDALEEKTTTVHGKTLPEQLPDRGFSIGMAPTMPAISPKLAAALATPESVRAPVQQVVTSFASAPGTNPYGSTAPSVPSTLVDPMGSSGPSRGKDLMSLFEGEVPNAGESQPLGSAAMDLHDPIASPSPPAPAPSQSGMMVARRGAAVKDGGGRTRMVLMLLLLVAAIGGGAFYLAEDLGLQAPTDPLLVNPPPPPTPVEAVAVNAAAPAPAAEKSTGEDSAAVKPVAAAGTEAATPPVAPEEPPAKPEELAKPAAAAKPGAVSKPAVAPPVAAVKPAQKPKPRVARPGPVVAPDPVKTRSSTEDIYWLRVQSTPSGADVYVDGNLEGKTPYERRLFDATEPHALSIRMEGFESHERLLSSSDPWIEGPSGYSLMVRAKLRKTAPAPEPAGDPAPVPDVEPAKAPAPETDPTLLP